MNHLSPELAQKRVKLNDILSAANSEYDHKFVEAVGVLEELEHLQQWAGNRRMTRRQPLFAAEVKKQYEMDLQRITPSTVDEDETRVKALMNEIKKRLSLPYLPTASMKFQAYYVESDRAAVEACEKKCAQFEKDLKEVIEAIKQTHKEIEEVRNCG